MANFPYPVSDSSTSFWRAGQLDALDGYQDPEWPDHRDIVIIGAGYAGASLAFHLLEKSKHLGQTPSIAIVEAREACSGATGRNGGHLKPDAYLRPGDAIDTDGKIAAEEVTSFEFRHLKAIGDLVKRENIDCDYMLTRTTDVCLYDKGRDELKFKLDKLTKTGISTVEDVFYSPAKTSEVVSGVKGAKGCFTHTAGHLWPYKLILHLLGMAVKEGVNLQTHTPVKSVSAQRNSDGWWTVDTARGFIKARIVIHATNAYAAALLPEYKDKIVPVRGICSRIVSQKAHPPLLSNSYTLRFNDVEYDYLIPRTDGSIIVGGARRDYYHALDSWFNVHDDSKMIESAEHYFDGYMQRTFHGWEDSGAYTEKVWTGIMGYTSDGYPHIGEVPDRPGQYICAGFSGHGMPQAFLSAKAIAAAVIEGQRIEDTDLPMLYRASKERLKSSKQHVTLAAYDATMRQTGAKL